MISYLNYNINMHVLSTSLICQSVAIACKHLVVVLHLKLKNLCGSQSQLCNCASIVAV